MNSTSTTSKRRIWLTAYAPLLIWTVFVFGLGSGIGAMNETSRIIRPLLEWLFPNSPAETLTFYHGIIRKFAHFFEYAVLAFLACRALVGVKFRFAIALIFVAMVASVDEMKQSLDASRTGSPWDVALDIFGGAAAICTYWFFTTRNKSE